MKKRAWKAKFGFTAVAIIAFISGSGAIQAADWRFLAKSGTGVPLYYDRESLDSSAGEAVTVWTKAVFEQAEVPVAGLEGYSCSLGLIEMNCKEKVFIVRRTVVYDREGSYVFSAYSPRWEFLHPEPQLDALFAVVCGALP